MPIRVQTPLGIVEFPDGMSPDDMRQALIKADLKKKQDTLVKANETPLQEPTTKIGGWIKGLNDYATELGQQMFEGAAHPKDAGDILGLMMPAVGPQLIKGLRSIPTDVPLETVEPLGNKAIKFGARRAADVLDLTPNVVSSKTEERIIKGLRDFGESKRPEFKDLPLAQQQEYLPTDKPNPERAKQGTIRLRETSINDKPLADQTFPERPNPETRPAGGMPPTPGNMNDLPLYRQQEILEQLGSAEGSTPTRGGGPTASGNETSAPPTTPPPRLVKSEPSSSLEDVLNNILQEGDDVIPEAGTSLPPQAETVGEGSLQQSGKFPKSQQKGQAGGYSSGRPGITDTQYQELLQKLGGTGPEGAVSGPPTTPEGPVLPESFPPEGGQGEWHSGAAPGSAEAKSAMGLHKATRELDDLYKLKMSDPLAALLLSIGGAGLVNSIGEAEHRP